MSSFQATSVRIGELRIEDLPSHVGHPEHLTILALDAQGVPTLVEVGFAQKWGNGWATVFACPLCASPARVLLVSNDLVACGRCKRRPTVQSRRKNQASWSEGQLADELAQALLNDQAGKDPQMRSTARKLRRRALGNAEASLALAAGAIGVANRALRQKHG